MKEIWAHNLLFEFILIFPNRIVKFQFKLLKSNFPPKFQLITSSNGWKKKINFLSSKRGNHFPPLREKSFSSIEGKIIFLANSFATFIVLNNGKLKNHFLIKLSPPPQPNTNRRSSFVLTGVADLMNPLQSSRLAHCLVTFPT